MKRTRLRTLRVDKDLTQSRLLPLVRPHLPSGRTMSQGRYSQIENGEGSEPDDVEKDAIATALGVRRTAIEWPDFPKAQAS